MKKYLLEDNRIQFLNKSKSSYKGKQRYERRKKSKIENTVKAMNGINMDKLFKEDILTIQIPVHGETDNYIVTISYKGLLELLRKFVENNNGVCTLREISKACIEAFNSNDVYIHCNCPDYIYRFNYWRTQQKQNSAEPETRPSKITNPNDKLGSGCKHVLLALSNNSWVLRVARVLKNYISYMENHYKKLYADIIYPAIYGEEYEDTVELSLFDDDNLVTDKDTIDIANKETQDSTRFQVGNKQGNKFIKQDNDEQNTIFNSDDEF